MIYHTLHGPLKDCKRCYDGLSPKQRETFTFWIENVHVYVLFIRDETPLYIPSKLLSVYEVQNYKYPAQYTEALAEIDKKQRYPYGYYHSKQYLSLPWHWCFITEECVPWL